MDLANATTTSFKSFLHDYYYRAVRMNLDNPRIFKTHVLEIQLNKISRGSNNVLHVKCFFFPSFTYILFLGPQ